MWNESVLRNDWWDRYSVQRYDEVPIGFVGVGDIAESGDGALWLVVAGEEDETSTEDHLRRYVTG